jgi:methionyl-tRNA formyltransferase
LVVFAFFRLDGGHILSQQTFPLPADATFVSLSEFLAARGADAVISTLKSLSTEQTADAQRVKQLMLDSKAAAVSMMSSTSARPAASTTGSTARKAPKLLPSQERIDFQQTSDVAYRTFRALHGTHFHAAGMPSSLPTLFFYISMFEHYFCTEI